MPRRIRKIVMHCSASEYGCVHVIDEWHRARGWSGIGYAYLVLNGRPFADSDYVPALDGFVEYGRPADRVGAHVKGHNHDSLGVCLVGDTRFTAKQVEAAVHLVRGLLRQYDLEATDVFGHRDFTDAKTCPNFETVFFRELLTGARPITSIGGENVG